VAARREGRDGRNEAMEELKQAQAGIFGEARGRWDPSKSHPSADAGVRSPRGGRRLSAVGTRRVRARGWVRGHWSWAGPACARRPEGRCSA
jgi:hypothetical protein